MLRQPWVGSTPPPPHWVDPKTLKFLVAQRPCSWVQFTLWSYRGYHPSILSSMAVRYHHLGCQVVCRVRMMDPLAVEFLDSVSVAVFGSALSPWLEGAQDRTGVCTKDFNGI